jgi:hypothetical protein
MHMLRYLEADPAARKPLLLTCACCYGIWNLLPDYCREWVQLAEKVAEGRLAPERLDDGWEGIEGFLAGNEHEPLGDGPCYAVLNIAAGCWGNWDDFEPGNQAWARERRGHAAIIREIFGNPFRPVALAPAWLMPAVVTLARAAYEGRSLPEGTLDGGRLAVLADALEEARCDNTEILEHLRLSGPHVRGCWALDLILSET